ncbi:MAG: hypothetical protein RLZZ244_2961 [Verrucomicrobiota bacterium]|jgi:hypothetical protein
MSPRRSSRQTLRLLAALALASGPALSPLQAALPSDLAQLDFFEKKIRPVLVESCYECHSAKSEKLRGGLLLDSSEGVLKGGDSGPALVPGNPKKSLLLTSIRHEHKDPDMAMPPKKDRLSEAVLADFEAWIQMGAPDPRTGSNPARNRAWDPEVAAKHWAFQPIANPAPPKVRDPQQFIQNPIDAFVLAKLTQHKLKPSPKADKQTLLRRLSYDLTGLPPSPEDVDAFLADSSPNALESAVDRLLASPQYGERWARHWMDIARYADTSGDRANGRGRPPLYAYAWTYRDYVINAFNQDLPYHQFLLEQIAADRLPEAKEDVSKLAALGFLTVGKRFMGNENDLIDDRIDVVTKGLMGLTGACARCHDHKFDPIPTRDYYALHGVFASSVEPDLGPAIRDPESHPRYPEYLAETTRIQEEVQRFEASESARLAAGLLERPQDYLLLAHESSQSADSSKKGTNFRLAARQSGLKAELAATWFEQLTQAENARKKGAKDPLLGPWLIFASLPAEAFAEKTPEILAKLQETPEFSRPVVDALVAKAPASLKDVAAVYGELFGSLRNALALPEFVAGRNARAGGFDLSKTTTTLADPTLEILRAQYFAPQSALLPSTTTVARTFGVAYTTAVGAIRAKTTQLNFSHPGAPVRAMVLQDAARPKDSPVLIRGEAGNRGPIVPRHFLTALGGSEDAPFKDGSGRLELARKIASRDNPLTARVLVNRVWQWHFGQGIVRTPSDFGTRAEAPTHPELLDWLATWFMDHDWSLKQLHKLIVLSSTYQQDSRIHQQGMQADPTNQWLWRFNLQRLDFEQIRDTLLTVSGQLDRSSTGGHPFRLAGDSARPAVPLKKGAGTPPPEIHEDLANQNRRSLYAMIDRSSLPEILQTFDFANPDISTGERILTTVPQQALFLLNSPFVAEQVRAILARPDFPKNGSAEDKIRFLYRTSLQRAPSKQELKLGEQFLSSGPQSGLESPNPLLFPAPTDPPAARKKPVAAADRTLSLLERYTQVVLLTNELMYVR